MSEDDLVRCFRSDLGDTSRDGGACIPLHPIPPAFTSASRRDRACRDLDLPKTLCRESGFFATRHRGERSPRVEKPNAPLSGQRERQTCETAPIDRSGPRTVARRSTISRRLADRIWDSPIGGAGSGISIGVLTGRSNRDSGERALDRRSRPSRASKSTRRIRRALNRPESVRGLSARVVPAVSFVFAFSRRLENGGRGHRGAIPAHPTPSTTHITTSTMACIASTFTGSVAALKASKVQVRIRAARDRARALPGVPGIAGFWRCRFSRRERRDGRGVEAASRGWTPRSADIVRNLADSARAAPRDARRGGVARGSTERFRPRKNIPRRFFPEHPPAPTNPLSRRR